MRNSAFYKSCIWLSCVGWVVTVSAQKLPNVQESSQWLPETVIIDGKLSEWSNVLQAYNKATGIEYTLANNDKNFYLAIRSKDEGITAKIMTGGITLAVSTSGKDGDGPIITFPVTKPAYHIYNGEVFPSPKIILTDSTSIQKEILQFKEIKVFRFKGISDSLLSIYNEYNIKNKLAYSNGALIAEFAIPLDLLALSSTGNADVNYSIRLNGVTSPNPNPGAPPTLALIPRTGIEQAKVVRDQMDTQEKIPTYFSGKYTLSKK